MQSGRGNTLGEFKCNSTMWWKTKVDYFMQHLPIFNILRLAVTFSMNKEVSQNEKRSGI